MKLYCDVTEEDGCVGLFAGHGVEVVYTGCQLHTEPEKLREHPMAVKLAQECDFHFWFGMERPEKLIYTVPRTEIVGFDSNGGYFAAVEDRWLAGAAPLYYISPGFVCHRIASDGKSFAELGNTWRETMVPTDEIEAFPDKTAAGEKYDIRSVREILEM